MASPHCLFISWNNFLWLARTWTAREKRVLNKVRWVIQTRCCFFLIILKISRWWMRVDNARSWSGEFSLNTINWLHWGYNLDVSRTHRPWQLPPIKPLIYRWENWGAEEGQRGLFRDHTELGLTSLDFQTVLCSLTLLSHKCLWWPLPLTGIKVFMGGPGCRPGLSEAVK